MIRKTRFLSFLALAVCLSLFFLELATLEISYAQSTRPSFGGRRQVDTAGPGTVQSNYALNSSIDQIMDDSTTYDSRTLWIMSGLKDVTQPFWDPYDIDFERNDRAVTKAATMQGGRYLSQLAKGSELQPTFDYLKRSLADLKSVFNYSIQSDGEKTYVSRNKKGKKLLELSMEFNLSQGLDPNIRIGENFRFRYDYVNQRPLLEYGVNF